jgi:hypothetical protein
VGDPRTRHHDYEALIARLLEDGLAEGTVRADIGARVAAPGLLGACNCLTYSYRQGGFLSIDGLADTLLVSLLDGLRAPRAARAERAVPGVASRHGAGECRPAWLGRGCTA